HSLQGRRRRNTSGRSSSSNIIEPAKGVEPMPVNPIPEGYHSATPYLSVHDAAAAIDFYKKAFAAVEIMRFPVPGGKVAHAEIKIGDSHIMLADEFPEMESFGPKTLGGSTV